VGIIEILEVFNFLAVFSKGNLFPFSQFPGVLSSFPETQRCRLVNSEQNVTVRAGAAAACPGLDTEQVVQQLGHEFRMKNPVSRLDIRRNDGGLVFRIIPANKADAFNLFQFSIKSGIPLYSSFRPFWYNSEFET
jgi:hypothetical protein